MQLSVSTFAMLRKYGRTIEKTMSPFWVYLFALLGALTAFMVLASFIFCRVLSIESISIYWNVTPEGLVDLIGIKICLPFTKHQPCGTFPYSMHSKTIVALGFIRFTSSAAGSSFGSCATSLPCIAHCSMLFFNCFPSIMTSVFICLCLFQSPAFALFHPMSCLSHG